MRLTLSLSVAASLLTGSLVAMAQKPPPAAAKAPAPAATAPAPEAAPSAPPASMTPSAATPPPPPPPPGTEGPAQGAAPPPPPGAPPPPWGYPGYPVARAPEPPPDQLPYKEGQDIPPGYHLESSVRRGPVIAGSVMLGTGYLISAAIGISGVDNGVEELYPMFVPVVGPFITLGTFDFQGDFGGLAFIIVGIPLILDGLLQTGGGVLLVAGLASPRKYLARDGSIALTENTRLRLGSKISLEAQF